MKTAHIARPRGLSTVLWVPKFREMPVRNSRRLEDFRKYCFGEPGAARLRSFPDIDHDLNAGSPERSNKVGRCRTFITDCAEHRAYPDCVENRLVTPTY